MTEAACLPVAVSTPRYHILIFSIVYQIVSVTQTSPSHNFLCLKRQPCQWRMLTSWSEKAGVLRDPLPLWRVLGQKKTLLSEPRVLFPSCSCPGL